jgi:peptidoglycan hydrolase CwlO-like protein
MNFLENKLTQVIALVGIIGTLAGFGYTGATYVNRIDNLEAKIGGVKEADEGLGAIELRIEALETSITFINKTIDENLVIDAKSQADKIEKLKSDVATVEADIKNLKENTEGNPLSG